MRNFLVLAVGVIMGFLLLGQRIQADEVSVASWPELVTAWNNSSVTKITLSQNIVSTSTGTNVRTASIELDGNGYGIDYNAGTDASHSFDLNNATGIDNPVFKVHDIKLTATAGSGVEGFIYTNEASRSSNWTIDMENLSYSQGFTAGQRFMTVGGAKVKLSGNIDIQTNYENIVGAQSIDVAPNCTYYGVSNASSNSNGESSTSGAGGVSTWYMTSTAAQGNITIGQNANVTLINYRKSNIYPHIYYHFGEVLVDSGATFNLNGGSAGINWYLNDTAGHYIVKNNATMLVSSNTSGGTTPVIDYSNTTANGGNQGILVEPTGTLYVVGTQNTGVPLIQMTGSNANQYLTLNNPKTFDINNQGTGNNVAVNLTRGTFGIKNTNVTLWDNGKNTLTSAASSAYEKVEDFSYTAANGVQSSNATLASNYKNNSTARIAGLNDSLKINVQPWASTPNTTNPLEGGGTEQNALIWDTDKVVRARVSMGQLPASGKIDPNTGGLTYQTIWAVKDQVAVDLQDSTGVADTLATDDAGYVTLNGSYFQRATSNGGDLLSFYGKYAGFEDAVTADVTDKTPPAPVTLSSSATSNAEIVGKTEAGAKVEAEVSHDGGTTWVAVSNQAVADAEGDFNIGRIAVLETGDYVRVVATDQNGNRTPDEDTTVHDAELKGATKYQIIGGLNWIDQLATVTFGSHALSSKNIDHSAAENTNSDLTVADTRGTGKSWRIVARMVNELSNGVDQLVDVITFKESGNDHLLGQQDTVIMEHETTSDENVIVNDSWNNQDTGLFINISKALNTKVGDYTGEIGWTLQDVPVN